ncbi:hypothetical protein [Paenibacillus sp. FSL W8-0194]|uniref:DinB/UmuC family translesion DNA polymerase n=1 Tax=Paenibacillus sp. FSL W8-0194 TaxID=2921711 RepID=UPI0030D72D33
MLIVLQILLELCEAVGRRCREKGLMGFVVNVGCQGADFDRPTGFSRQMKLSDPTNITDEIYDAACLLFQRHWNGLPVRKIGISLTDLRPDSLIQLTLFGDRDRKRNLERATDGIKSRFGETAILRASSLQAAGQAQDRSLRIGGHYK